MAMRGALRLCSLHLEGFSTTWPMTVSPLFQIHRFLLPTYVQKNTYTPAFLVPFPLLYFLHSMHHNLVDTHTLFIMHINGQPQSFNRVGTLQRTGQLCPSPKPLFYINTVVLHIVFVRVGVSVCDRGLMTQNISNLILYKKRFTHPALEHQATSPSLLLCSQFVSDLPVHHRAGGRHSETICYIKESERKGEM